MAERQIHADGLPRPQRILAFAAVLITVILTVMDQTVANVALPTIATDFHATPTDAVAIVSAYQLAIVMLILPLSALAEIYGYRLVYLSGIAVFSAASLACVMADSLTWLTVARVVQGFGAAGIMSVNTALVRYIFPQHMLGRGIGINSMVVAIASTMGPSFAGIVLSFANWQWLFTVNLPLGIISFAIGYRNLPASDTVKRRFDVFSAISIALFFAMLITTIQSFSNNEPWQVSATEAAIGLIAITWSVLRQLPQPTPLLPVDLLRRPIFALSVVTSITCFTAQMLALVALPFFFEAKLGFNVTETGLLIMTWPLTIACVSSISGRLADRYPAAILNFFGLICLSTGLTLLSFLPPHTSYINVIWRMMICGMGFGFFQPPNNRVIMTSAPKPRSGAASGSIATSRILGQAMGAALAALLLAKLGYQGAVTSLDIGAAFAAAAAFISLLRLA
ncbi:MAG: MFS transporter [Acidocella sp. 20-57-95]|nr:MAG: MFS transporter [Acidocella sp. 20-57-95]HQT64686.1 MFS transporter [Acidocella sp.]